MLNNITIKMKLIGIVTFSIMVMIVGGSIAWCNFNHVQGEWNEFLDVVQHKQHELVHIRAAIGIVHTAGIADITVKGNSTSNTGSGDTV